MLSNARRDPSGSFDALQLLPEPTDRRPTRTCGCSLSLKPVASSAMRQGLQKYFTTVLKMNCTAKNSDKSARPGSKA